MQPEVLTGIGIAVLLLAMIVGVMMSRRRNRANDKVTDAAVRAQYSNPDGYDPKSFEKQLK